MVSNRKRRLTLGACFTVGVLTAASLGYVAGSVSHEPEQVKDGIIAEATTFTAVSASGQTSTLTGEDAETYEEFSTPIDQSEVTFDENVELSPVEVAERKEALATDYVVGEPLSLEDLEFLRAYLIDGEPAADAGTPVIETVAFGGSGSVAPAALYNLNQPFNVTRSGAGATANANGRVTGGINIVDANWGVSWTTKRTGGAALTKITSSVRADAFGAVAGWPFVGLVYSRSYSATSPSGASSWSFARSGKVVAAVAYMQVDCKSFVYTKSGSFSLP
jgi:hypothetical protein